MATKFMFAAAAALVLVIALAGWRTQGVKNESRVKDEFRFDAAKLKDKALWNRVNDEPYYLTHNIAISCVAPTAVPSDKTPPVAHVLITLAPYLI